MINKMIQVQDMNFKTVDQDNWINLSFITHVLLLNLFFVIAYVAIKLIIKYKRVYNPQVDEYIDNKIIKYIDNLVSQMQNFKSVKIEADESLVIYKKIIYNSITILINNTINIDFELLDFSAQIDICSKNLKILEDALLSENLYESRVNSSINSFFLLLIPNNLIHKLQVLIKNAKNLNAFQEEIKAYKKYIYNIVFWFWFFNEDLNRSKNLENASNFSKSPRAIEKEMMLEKMKKLLFLKLKNNIKEKISEYHYYENEMNSDLKKQIDNLVFLHCFENLIVFFNRLFKILEDPQYRNSNILNLLEHVGTFFKNHTNEQSFLIINASLNNYLKKKMAV
jgi:hypothetical protein